MSIFFAMDMYDVPENDMNIYTDNFCNSNAVIKYNQTERCLLMYRNIYRYIFDNDLNTLTPNDNICFKNLIVGQDTVFGQQNFELARAGFIRRFRDRVLLRAGLTSMLTHKSIKQVIVVLTKDTNESILYKSKYLEQRLCNMVQEQIAAISPQPEVICISNIASMSFQSQLELALKATLVITEHGTTSYFVLFLRTGAVAIVLSPLQDEDGMKDGQILLHLTHLRVFYLRPTDEYGELEDTIFESDLRMTLFHSLHTTADNFNIDMTILENFNTDVTALSGRLNRIIDSKTQITFEVNSMKSIFDIIWSHDRCTSTYKWCLNTYDRDIDLCENIYNYVKHLMKPLDEKGLYTCE